MNKEVWVNVIGFEEYQISSHGRIWSNISGKIIKLDENNAGYFRVTFY